MYTVVRWVDKYLIVHIYILTKKLHVIQKTDSMEALALVRSFNKNSCHSSLPSVILVTADNFDMQHWWWGKLSLYYWGKWSQQNGCYNVDLTGGFQQDVETEDTFKYISENRFLFHKSNSFGSFSWICFFSNILQYLTSLIFDPSAAAHLQAVLGTVSTKQKKQMCFTQKENGVFCTDINKR